MKIYIIDFSKTNEIADKCIGQFDIFTEKQDGGNAYSQIGEIMPDIIFVNYKDKPSHGRQTAQSIKERKKTSNIPIYFVAGEKNENEKAKHIGLSITINEIEKYILKEKKTSR
jgi:PleD family two-component response regulator